MSTLLYKYKPELVSVTPNAHWKVRGITFLFLALSIIFTVSLLSKYPFISMGLCVAYLFIVVKLDNIIIKKYFYKSQSIDNDNYLEIYTDKIVCRQRTRYNIFKVAYDTCEIYYDEINSSIITEDNELKITLKKIEGNRKSSYTLDHYYDWFYIRIFGYPNELKDKIYNELKELLQLSYWSRRRS